MAHLIQAYRDVLMYGQSPDSGTLRTLTLVSLGSLGVSYWLFRRASVDFAEEI